MYCMKCGQEVNNGTQFCPHCGTKLGTTGKTLNVSTDDIKKKVIEVGQSVSVDTDRLGKNKLLWFVNIGLFFLSLIFAMLPAFSVDYDYLSVAHKMSLFDELLVLRLIFIAAYVTSLVLLALPVLFSKKVSKKMLLAEKITGIVILLYFFLLVISGANETSSNDWTGIASFSITATGWLFMICTVGALIISYKLSADIKKSTKKSESIPSPSLDSDKNNQEYTTNNNM